MEFFRIQRDIPFMRHALVFNVISAITFVLAVIFLATRGLNLGVDFRGGTLIEVAYDKAVDLNHVRAAIDKLKLGEYAAQSFGTANTALIRVPLKEGLSSAQLSDQVMAVLREADPSARQQRVEFVGPQVGKELFDNGALALLLVSLGIVGYLAMRFEWRFAVAAIIANLHDVVIILGFFAFFQWEFSLPVLAAVLAVLGYSVNESVVIADRIRENFRKMRKATVTHVIDNAITRTISRTIITHGMTLMMVLSILFFGGETLHYFALALTIGICFGIYSSVLVMAPLVMWLGVSREDLVKPERRGEGGAEKIPALMLTTLFYSLLALDQSVAQLAAQYGQWLYALLFLIIFAETGLVVFPFLPGDSILFISGTVVATADLNIHVLVSVLTAAAILGDTVNYSVGHYIGPRVFDRPDSRWFKQAHLRRTQAFYDKYGGVTIIIGRFVPIVRTFAPFLAGVAGMRYHRFLSFNVIGAVAWIASLSYAGYLFGNIPWVKQNLTLIVIGIVALSLIPAVSTFIKERRAARSQPPRR